jgi:hypothetical protein
MVERAAAGAAPSSPQPPEAGALRARLVRRREWNRQTLSSSRCGADVRMRRLDPAQPTLNMWLTCPWRRGALWLRASARSSCRSRMCERTAHDIDQLAVSSAGGVAELIEQVRIGQMAQVNELADPRRRLSCNWDGR